MKSKKAQSQAQSKLDLAKINTDKCIFSREDEQVQSVFALVCHKIEDSAENITGKATTFHAAFQAAFEVAYEVAVLR